MSTELDCIARWSARRYRQSRLCRLPKMVRCEGKAFRLLRSLITPPLHAALCLPARMPASTAVWVNTLFLRICHIVSVSAPGGVRLTSLLGPAKLQANGRARVFDDILRSLSYPGWHSARACRCPRYSPSIRLMMWPHLGNMPYDTICQTKGRLQGAACCAPTAPLQQNNVAL
jgi:hypothetical protein